MILPFDMRPYLRLSRGPMELRLSCIVLCKAREYRFPLHLNDLLFFSPLVLPLAGSAILGAAQE